MRTDYLIDTSAIVRLLRDRELREKWGEIIGAGMISYCGVTELEMIRSVRSRADEDAIRETLETMFGWEPMPEQVFARAREVQRKLVSSGQHRAPGPVDLLLSATAELSGLSVLHYDADFESVARVTGQPSRWLAPRGSIA